MEDEKVKVTADEAGRVIIVSTNNPDWAYIRLEQHRFLINDRNFVTKRPLSTLLHGSVDDLKSFNWLPNQEISGKIIIIEQLTPFDKKNPERDYKKAGDTGIICRVGEDPIYRKTLYKLNTKTDDTLLMHTNTEEIKAYNNEHIPSLAGLHKL
jgi:hypothetical protein